MKRNWKCAYHWISASITIGKVYQVEIKEIIDVLKWRYEKPNEVSSDILNFYIEKDYFL